jgi:N-methylhydantoinase A
LLGDVVKDYSRTVMLKAADVNTRQLEREFSALEQQAAKALQQEGFTKGRIKFQRAVAMRYIGQSFEIDVNWGKTFEQQFHALHRERYGYADSSRPTEIVSLRLKAIGVTEKPTLRRAASHKPHAPEVAYTAKVFLSERASSIPVYEREKLATGASFTSPALVTEYSSTTLIPAGWQVEVDGWLNLLISKKEAKR